MSDQSRRNFVKTVGAATGAAAIAPLFVGCGTRSTENAETTTPTQEANIATDTTEATPTVPDIPEEFLPMPTSRPDDWDPIAFNRFRGNDGAIPNSYLDDINGEDGETAHLGKHLPFVAEIENLPEGKLAIMWGNPELGHAKHPNSPVGTENYERGHWYNWVRVRKATDDESDVDVVTRFSNWPEIGEGDNGSYAVLEGGDITADEGRNTVYIVELPPNVAAGDTIRIHAHCLYHGEYVDFITL